MNQREGEHIGFAQVGRSCRHSAKQSAKRPLRQHGVQDRIEIAEQQAVGQQVGIQHTGGPRRSLQYRNSHHCGGDHPVATLVGPVRSASNPEDCQEIDGARRPRESCDLRSDRQPRGRSAAPCTTSRGATSSRDGCPRVFQKAMGDRGISDEVCVEIADLAKGKCCRQCQIGDQASRQGDTAIRKNGAPFSGISWFSRESVGRGGRCMLQPMLLTPEDHVATVSMAGRMVQRIRENGKSMGKVRYAVKIS